MCIRVIKFVQCQTHVLVDEQGHAVLTGFSRAKVIGDAAYSDVLVGGAAAYMAPELFPLTDVHVDNLFSKESDVYAFGMLCFEVSHTFHRISYPHNISQILTNQEPFASYNARQVWQLVPLIHQGKRPICTSHVQRYVTRDIWAIMEACWTTVPANRPSAAQIMQRML